jgi:hypothetical protein
MVSCLSVMSSTNIMPLASRGRASWELLLEAIRIGLGVGALLSKLGALTRSSGRHARFTRHHKGTVSEAVMGTTELRRDLRAAAESPTAAAPSGCWSC